MLVILGESNPVFTAPADFKFAEAIRKVSLRRALGIVLRRDGDAVPLARAGGALPRSVERRALGRRHRVDRAAADQPIYGGKSAHELVATLSDRPERNGYDIVREYWQANGPKSGAPTPADVFEKQWRKWLHDGVIARHGLQRGDSGAGT